MASRTARRHESRTCDEKLGWMTSFAPAGVALANVLRFWLSTPKALQNVAQGREALRAHPGSACPSNSTMKALDNKTGALCNAFSVERRGGMVVTQGALAKP